MIFSDEVKVKWHGATRSHYEELGYLYTKKDQEFIVKATELSRGSNILIRYKCDYCGIIGRKRNDTLMDQRKIIKKDSCKQCAHLKHNEVKIKSHGSLSTKYPTIAKEWCSISNTGAPNQLTPYSKKKVVWVCEKEHSWRTSVYSRTLQNTGCPFCNESRGEKAISDILKKLKVPFIREVTFSDLRGYSNSLLRYDFAILNCAGVIKAVIEYDGPFHFGEVYPGDNHKRTMELDLVKDAYCSDSGIPLYRIPYHKYDNLPTEIDEILRKEGLIDVGN